MTRTAVLFLFCLWLAVVPVPALAQDPTPLSCDWAQVTAVVDGDTIDVVIGATIDRVRYIGMNTAERGQPCYSEATAANSSLVQGQTVCLDRDVSETDRYGRLLRYVYVGETMVNAELVRQGLASAATYPPDVRYADWFVQLEQEARAAGRGCWAAGTTYAVWLPIVVRPTPRPTPTPTRTPAPTPTRTLAPTPTRTPTPTQVPSSAAVRVASWCSRFDAPGNDNNNLNEEYVCFENAAGGAANISGWHVKDLVNHTYTFPTFMLAPGARVKLHTGCGSNTATDLYWCSGGAIWNNDHDTVFLYDSAWHLVDSHSY